MLKRKIRIATRQSPLALWQATHIKKQIERLNASLNIELLPLVTQGDKLLESSLVKFGGKGLFVKELEKAMLEGHADLAVHSMKDVPVHFPQGLGLIAITQRDNPFDALVSNTFTSIDELPKEAVIGTSSMRRHCQLLALRPDLNIQICRGNVNTRLKKLDAGQYDGIILAQAGLTRLGFTDRIQQTLSPGLMIPACGQGALGLECRLNDEELIELLQQLACAVTSNCVEAERLVNLKLGGNCQVPLAVFCQEAATGYVLESSVGNCQTGQLIHAKASGPNPVNLAEDVSANLLAQGAKALMEQAKFE